MTTSIVGKLFLDARNMLRYVAQVPGALPVARDSSCHLLDLDLLAEVDATAGDPRVRFELTCEGRDVLAQIGPRG